MMPVNATTPRVNALKNNQNAPVIFDANGKRETEEGAKAQMGELESRNKKKGLIMIGISVFFLGLYGVLFFFESAIAYFRAPGEIESLNREVAWLDEQVIPDLESQLNLHRSAFEEDFEELDIALSDILPDDAQKLEIVQLLESFASEVSFTNPPFEFNAITFGSEQQMEGYTIIPISTSIHSSQEAFSHFLALVERSGLIYADESQSTVLDKVVRLMSISNINVKYRGVDEETGLDQGIDFSVKLNVYYQSEGSDFR